MTPEELSSLTTEELTNYDSNWMPAYIVLAVIPVLFLISACYANYRDRRNSRTVDLEAIAAHRTLYNSRATNSSSNLSEKPIRGGMPNANRRPSALPVPPPSWNVPAQKKKDALTSPSTTSFYLNPVQNISAMSVSSFYQTPAPPAAPFYSAQLTGGSGFGNMSNVSLASPAVGSSGGNFYSNYRNPSVVSFSVPPPMSPMVSQHPPSQLRPQSPHPPHPQLLINGVDAWEAAGPDMGMEVEACTGSGTAAQETRRAPGGVRRGETPAWGGGKQQLGDVAWS